MAANYGGTNIGEALERIFASRRTDLPTSCFVLTDGQVSLSFHSLDVVLNGSLTRHTTLPNR